MASPLLIAFREVSIHAPREGCDCLICLIIAPVPLFQFTHPVRGATDLLVAPFSVEAVSIHAPREGCDLVRSDPTPRPSRFNSRTP